MGEDGTPAVAEGWILPNSAVPDATPLSKFMVHPHLIDTLSGYRFFPELGDVLIRTPSGGFTLQPAGAPAIPSLLAADPARPRARL